MWICKPLDKPKALMSSLRVFNNLFLRTNTCSAVLKMVWVCFKSYHESLAKRLNYSTQKALIYILMTIALYLLGTSVWDKNLNFKNSYGTSITTICSFLIKLQCSCSWFYKKHHMLSSMNPRQSFNQATRRNFKKSQRQGTLYKQLGKRHFWIWREVLF